MKELSIEEKAKAYDIALDKLKRLFGTGDNCTREEAEYIFPELKESEDEKIKSQIMSLVNFHMGADFSPEWKQKCLDWLEKQEAHEETGSHGYIQMNKSYKCIASPRYTLFRIGEVYRPDDAFLCSLMNLCHECFVPIEGKEEQKPAEWNKEDEEISEAIIKRIKGESEALGVSLSSAICWIENVKDRVQPQPKQEWSEEDEAFYQRLEQIVCNVDIEAFQGDIDLHTWLKSLRSHSHWKPDSSMLICLQYAINHISKEGDKNILSKLLEQLKKL